MSKGSRHERAFKAVIALLSSVGRPIPVREICERTGIVCAVACQVISLCKTRRVKGFQVINNGNGISGQYIISDGIVRADAPVPKRFFFVDDLYRGWFNPLTGLTGTKLGVDREPRTDD